MSTVGEYKRDTTIAAEMKRAELRGLHTVKARNNRGEVSTAVLELRYRRIVVRPPKDKEKRCPELVFGANEE